MERATEFFSICFAQVKHKIKLGHKAFVKNWAHVNLMAC